MKIYTITAANGRIGNRVARKLLAAGQRVRALGRNRVALQLLGDLGAEIMVGELADRDYVERAFDGADAALLIDKANFSAPSFAQAFGEAGAVYAEAARATRLPNAVFISAMGSHDPTLRGLIGAHGDVEKLLDAVKTLRTVHLRAASFIENLFYFADAVVKSGSLVTPINPQSPVDWITTSDVADVAYDVLMHLPLAGSTIEVHGARSASMDDIAALISRELGRSFHAAHQPRAEHVQTMLSKGVGRDFAERMNDTWEYFSARMTRDAHAPETRLGATSLASFVKTALVPALFGGAQVQTEM